jgi:hypothetical protein
MRVYHALALANCSRVLSDLSRQVRQGAHSISLLEPVREGTNVLQRSPRPARRAGPPNPFPTHPLDILSGGGSIFPSGHSTPSNAGG